MITFLTRMLVAAGAAFAVLPSAQAAEPAIIAKARAYLGAEAALEGIKSVHYTGTLVVTSTDPAAKPTPAAMELIFQKPFRQRIKATSATAIEVTALDEYEGWQRLQNPADATKWQQSLLGSDQVKRLRANTWENLSFFRGIEKIGGRIEDRGPVTFEGIACQKLAYIHAPAVDASPGIIFVRYFEAATGRLVYTETENGSSIRESGEIRVNGIRFPKTMTSTTKNATGQVQTFTVTFDKITVNEVFAPDEFAVPSLSTR